MFHKLPHRAITGRAGIEIDGLRNARRAIVRKVGQEVAER
jgi:hypothetical protein